MPCLSVEAKRRIVLLHSCSKAFLNIFPKCVPCMSVTHMAIPCLTIPPVEHGKLHKTCMLHATL